MSFARLSTFCNSLAFLSACSMADHSNPGLSGVADHASLKDQRSGKLTQGIVKDILTKSSSHTHGIKVRLESVDIGRVKEIITPDNDTD